MADPARARRLAKRIMTIVASAAGREVKDPRLASVTITAATVTADLREATVYYTVYGDDAARADAARALGSARGILRSLVGSQTGIKFTPSLSFVPDAVPEQSRHITELLETVRRNDAELAARAVGAAYAGDADPYRRPADEEDLPDDREADEAAGRARDRGAADPADGDGAH